MSIGKSVIRPLKDALDSLPAVFRKLATRFGQQGKKSGKNSGDTKRIDKKDTPEARRLRENHRRGKDTEKRVPGDQNGKKITVERTDANGNTTTRDRIPDRLDERTLTMGEIKDVKRQSLTRQLRDMIHYAQENGYEMTLFVRPDGGTRITGPLRELLDDPNVPITLDFIPGIAPAG